MKHISTFNVNAGKNPLKMRMLIFHFLIVEKKTPFEFLNFSSNQFLNLEAYASS
jgi:hypothetical protein